MGISWIIIDFFNVFSLGWFARQVTEDDIVQNVYFLKEEKKKWFEERLENKKYKNLIIHDRDVRTMIGQFEPQKMKRSSYAMRQQKRIDRILMQKANV